MKTLSATFVPQGQRKGKFQEARPVMVTSGSGQTFRLTKAETFHLLEDLRAAYGAAQK